MAIFIKQFVFGPLINNWLVCSPSFEPKKNLLLPSFPTTILQIAPQKRKIPRDIDSLEFQDQLRKHRLDPSEQNPFLRIIRLKKSEIEYDC